MRRLNSGLCIWYLSFPTGQVLRDPKLRNVKLEQASLGPPHVLFAIDTSKIVKRSEIEIENTLNRLGLQMWY